MPDNLDRIPGIKVQGRLDFIHSASGLDLGLVCRRAPVFDEVIDSCDLIIDVFLDGCQVR